MTKALSLKFQSVPIWTPPEREIRQPDGLWPAETAPGRSGWRFTPMGAAVRASQRAETQTATSRSSGRKVWRAEEGTACAIWLIWVPSPWTTCGEHFPGAGLDAAQGAVVPESAWGALVLAL